MKKIFSKSDVLKRDFSITIKFLIYFGPPIIITDSESPSCALSESVEILGVQSLKGAQITCLPG